MDDTMISKATRPGDSHETIFLPFGHTAYWMAAGSSRTVFTSSSKWRRQVGAERVSLESGIISNMSKKRRIVFAADESGKTGF